jgi:hypothetical protein
MRESRASGTMSEPTTEILGCFPKPLNEPGLVDEDVHDDRQYTVVDS